MKNLFSPDIVIWYASVLNLNSRTLAIMKPHYGYSTLLLAKLSVCCISVCCVDLGHVTAIKVQCT